MKNAHINDKTMKYNQSKTAAGQVMPLLMGCTMPTPIETETAEQMVIYDPMSQRVVMDLRIVGTKSLKTHITHNPKTLGNTGDKKNEIDDQKQVR
jgi:hypothetical protein